MRLLLLVLCTALHGSEYDRSSVKRDYDREAIREIERERDVTKRILTERLHVIDRQLDYLRVRLQTTPIPEVMMAETEKVNADKMAMLALINRLKK